MRALRQGKKDRIQQCTETTRLLTQDASDPSKGRAGVMPCEQRHSKQKTYVGMLQVDETLQWSWH